jgi:uncharacterized membrane protein
MTVIQRIGLASAFKVGLVVYGCLGLVAGVLCSAIAFAQVQLAGHPHMPFGHWGGVLALILCPLIYGLIGGIAAFISAFLYNLASGWVGGLQVEIK